MRQDNINSPSCNFGLEDVMLKVCSQIGDEVEEDALCHLVFMAPLIDRVGFAIRNVYWWVSQSEIFYLVIDNACVMIPLKWCYVAQPVHRKDHLPDPTITLHKCTGYWCVVRVAGCR